MQMATQLKIDELEGCKSYFEWLCEKAIPQLDDDLGSEGAETPLDISEDTRKVKLCRFLYGMDFFVCDDICPEDATQGVNGMDLRRRYAESVGRKVGKSERDIDRIKKSIHGKCSVFELIIHLCNRLDEMTNEEESGKTIWRFFDIMLENLEIDITDSENGWATVIGNFLHRNYGKDGTGGLFPVRKSAGKDLRKMSLWDQLNTWLNEHLDEDAQFKW